MIEFSEEQKKVVTAIYDLLCEHKFNNNEIDAVVFRGTSIYKILADKIYVLEDRVMDYNKHLERYFDDKDVLGMLKDNGKRQEMLDILENLKLQIKDANDSKLFEDFDSVIAILKNLGDIVNKYEGQFEVKKGEKCANVIITKSSNDKIIEINVTDNQPIISIETFDKAKLKYEKQTNN